MNSVTIIMTLAVFRRIRD